MAMAYVKVYYDWSEAISPLSDDAKGRLFAAVICYAKTGELIDLSGPEKYVFPMLKLQIDRDKASYVEISGKNRKNGFLGGRPKNQSVFGESEANPRKANKTQNNRTVFDETQKSQDQDQDQDQDQEVIPPIPPKGGAFDRFWKAYPKKVGKAVALKSFQRINVPVETLISAVETQKQSRQWKSEGGRFIPNPSTWLNQGRWDDEPQAEEVNQHGGNGQAAGTGEAPPSRWNIHSELDGL